MRSPIFVISTARILSILSDSEKHGMNKYYPKKKSLRNEAYRQSHCSLVP